MTGNCSIVLGVLCFLSGSCRGHTSPKTWSAALRRESLSQWCPRVSYFAKVKLIHPENTPPFENLPRMQCSRKEGEGLLRALVMSWVGSSVLKYLLRLNKCLCVLIWSCAPMCTCTCSNTVCLREAGSPYRAVSSLCQTAVSPRTALTFLYETRKQEGRELEMEKLGKKRKMTTEEFQWVWGFDYYFYF